MISFYSAQRLISDVVSLLPGEWVSVRDALGRTTRNETVAQRTIPPWNNSAMDGYAVASGALREGHLRLSVKGTLYAGQTPSLEIQHPDCARVMTGAPLPHGADAVVMQE